MQLDDDIAQYSDSYTSFIDPPDIDDPSIHMNEERDEETHHAKSKEKKQKKSQKQSKRAELDQSLFKQHSVTDEELRAAIESSFRKKEEAEAKRIDLTKIFPKEVLKKPVFTNKHALETIQQLIRIDGLEACEHMPYVFDAMEVLLQKTRGIHTRQNKE